MLRIGNQGIVFVDRLVNSPSPSQSIDLNACSSIPFLGFSVEDQLIGEVREAQVWDCNCDIIKEELKDSTFESLAGDHPLYQRICHFIKLNPIGSSSPELFTVVYLFLTLIERNYLNNPIIDTQFIGSEIQKILFEHESLLEDSTRKNFEKHISVELLKKLIEACKRIKEKAKSNSADKPYQIDLDSSIICLNSPDSLTKQARQILTECYPDIASHLLNQFKIINKSTALISIKFVCPSEVIFINSTENIRGMDFILPIDIVCTNKPTNLSSDTCLSTSILPLIQGCFSDLKIQCTNFCAAKVILDLLCEIYTPTDVSNPQALVRLMYNSKKIPVGKKEEEMATHLFKPFEKAGVCNQQEFILVLKSLDYQQAGIEQMLSKKGTFSLSHEEWQTRYVYGLLKFKMDTKQLDPLRPCQTHSINSSFVFRFCQCLQTHTPFSDEAIYYLWLWLDEEKLLNFIETDPLLRLFLQAIVTDKVPFSVISSLLSIMGWLYHPQNFTQRLEPPIFFISHPFIMRLPAQLTLALQVLQNYLVSINNNIEILQKIYKYFPKTQESVDAYHWKLHQELQLPEHVLIEKSSELLNHSNSFVSLLGMQLLLTCPNGLQSILEQLPRLLKIQSDVDLTPFIYLQQRIHSSYYPGQSTDLLSLNEWIKILLNTTNANFIRLAYQFWNEYADECEPHLDVFLLEALCTFDPAKAAIHLNYIYQSNPDRFSPENLQALFIKIISSAQLLRQPFYLDELYPIITEWLSKAPYLEEPPSFSNVLLFYIEATQTEIETKRFSSLVVKAILKGHLPFSSLPVYLHKYLYPHLLYLLPYNSPETNLTLPPSAKELIFSSLDSSIELPYPVFTAWIEVLSWIFYPEVFVNYAEDYSINLTSSLHTLNTYIKTKDCRLTALHEIYQALLPHKHTDHHTELCKKLKVEELTLIQETITLLEHADPLISSVGLQTGVTIPGWRNPILFLIQLPKLLNSSQPHIAALEVLFKRIADHYQLSVSDLSPLLLNDWIKLLARTQEPDLLALALGIWKEHQEKLSKNLDLILFEALLSVNPPVALYHFCELNNNRNPPLSLKQTLTGFLLIMRSYQSNNHTRGLKKLYPLIKKLIKNHDEAFKTVKQKNTFYRDLLFFADCQNFPPQATRLLLKTVSKLDIKIDKILASKYIENFESMKKIAVQLFRHEINYFQNMRILIGQHLLETKDERVDLLVNELINEKMQPEVRDAFYLFLLKYLQHALIKNPLDDQHPHRLNKLTRIAPSARKQEALALATDFYNRILEQDLSQAPEATLNYVEDRLVKNLNNVHIQNKLLNYLTTIPITSNRLPNLWEIGNSLIKENSALSARLLYMISRLLKHHSIAATPPLIQRFITAKPEHLLSLLETSEYWESSQIYLGFFKQNNISFTSLIAQSWTFCKRLSTHFQLPISVLVEVLETQAPENWSTYFSKMPDKSSLISPIKIIIQRLSSEPAYDNLNVKWLTFLTDYYLRHLSTDLISDYSSEELIKLASQVLAHTPSAQTKRYFILSKPFISNPQMKQLAQAEIDKQCQSNQKDFIFWFEIILAYYPQCPEKRLELWKNLNECKNLTIINRVLDDLQSSNLEACSTLLDTWIEAFKILKHFKHEKIWMFLDQLPAVFTSHTEHIKLANQLLIESAALQLIQDPTKTKLEADLLQKILNKANCEETLPFETFALVLNSFTEDFIVANLVQCVNLTTRVFKQNHIQDLSLTKNRWENRFKKNFNFLITQGFSNLQHEQLQELGLCLESNLNIIIDNLDTLFTIIFFHYQRCYIPPLNQEAGEKYNIVYKIEMLRKFLEIYKTLSPAFISQPERFSELLYQPLSILCEIYLESQLAVEASKRSTEASLESHDVIKSLFSLLNEAMTLICPQELTSYPESYLEWIFAYFHAFSPKESIQKLRRILFQKINQKLDAKLAAKENIDHLVNIIKKALDGEIDRLYALVRQHSLLNLEDNLPIKNLFKEATILCQSLENNEVFNKNLWLLTRFYLVDITEKPDVTPLKPKLSYNFYFSLIERLLNYGSLVSFKYAFCLFVKHIAFEKTISQDKRLNLFQTLINSAAGYFLINCKGTSLLHSLDTYFLNIHENLLTLQAENGGNNYGSAMLKIKFQAALKYIQELQRNPSIDPSWRAHYIFCCLQYLSDQQALGFYNNHYKSYFANLTLLMDHIIDIECLYLNNKISSNYFIDGFKPFILNRQFSELLVKMHYTDGYTPANLIEEQHRTLVTWVRSLQQLRKISSDSTVIENVNQNIILFLCEIAHFSPTSQIHKKNQELCEQILDSLKNSTLNARQQIYYKILDFHFNHLTLAEDPSQFAKEFISNCELLESLSDNLEDIQSLHPILTPKTIAVLAEHPTVPDCQRAWNIYLKGAIDFYQRLDPDKIFHNQTFLLALIHKALTSKLFIPSEEGLKEWNRIKAWIVKHGYHGIYAQLCEFILLAPLLDKEKLSDQLNEFMPIFGKWIQNTPKPNELRISPKDLVASFTSLFDYVSDFHKKHLSVLWELCSKNPIKLISPEELTHLLTEQKKD